MRFEVSRVMDTIEQRLTTDVTLAQAVVDLGDVARFVALDGGRPINVLRLGMVVDALARYLIDAGAMLYPVAGRELLSEAALTSKERMVLGRWADDGLIEITPVVADRVVEIADFTGLPLVAVRDPRPFAQRFPWLLDTPERVLRLAPRAGGAVLTPAAEDMPLSPSLTPLVARGKATLPIVPLNPPEEPESANGAGHAVPSEPADLAGAVAGGAREGAVGDGALKDGAVGGGAVGDGAVRDGAVGGGAVGDRVVGGGAVESGAVGGGAQVPAASVEVDAGGAGPVAVRAVNGGAGPKPTVVDDDGETWVRSSAATAKTAADKAAAAALASSIATTAATRSAPDQPVTDVPSPQASTPGTNGSGGVPASSGLPNSGPGGAPHPGPSGPDVRGPSVTGQDSSPTNPVESDKSGKPESLPGSLMPDPAPGGWNESGKPAVRPPTTNEIESFAVRGAQKFSRTRVVRRRFTRADPSGIGAALMAREWRCVEPDCPAFGRYRRIGQPIPRMRAGVPACPRHGEAVKDVGPRPVAYAVSVVVDDLARRRFVVSGDRPVVVGRDPGDPDDIAVGEWLHEAAAAWIAERHVRLEVRDCVLVVTDTSENGTLVWKRDEPDSPEETERIYHRSYALKGWDSVELYTGVELVLGDHRLATIVGSEPASVLLDAPTVASRLVR